jgi:hypothetical protein
VLEGQGMREANRPGKVGIFGRQLKEDGWLALASGLVARGALEANGGDVNDVIVDPDIMTSSQPEPVSGLGGGLVLGDDQKLRGPAGGVSDGI